MRNFERLTDGSGARRPSDVVDSRALASGVPETIVVPEGASHVVFAASGDFYAQYYAEAPATLVINGGFGADTDWTKGTGWTIGTGVATASAGTGSSLSQTLDDLVAGQSYLLTYTLTRSAGTITPALGTTAGTQRNASGTYSEVIVAGADGGALSFDKDSSFAGTVDVVSVVACAGVPGDNATGYAAELVRGDAPEESRSRIITGVAEISVIAAATVVVTASFFQT